MQVGLRPGEIASLRLEDIDWRAGTLCLRERKTRRGAVLPLREERPAAAGRHVFVQHSDARLGGPLSSNAVSGVVVRALQRAGVEPPLAGAYVLRHTLASRMVNQGASLKEVADLLGHCSLDPAAIYAKLAPAALREVALPGGRR